MRFDNDAISVAVTGASITLAAASASATIPNMADATIARFVRLETTTSAHVRIGRGAQTAVATDMLVVTGGPVILSVRGQDTIAAIQAGTGGILIITPLEA